MTTVEDEVRAVARVAAFMADDRVHVDRTGAGPRTEVVGAIASGRLALRPSGAVTLTVTVNGVKASTELALTP